MMQIKYKIEFWFFLVAALYGCSATSGVEHRPKGVTIGVPAERAVPAISVSAQNKTAQESANSGYIPFGPDLPHEMETLAIGTMRWVDKETIEITLEESKTATNPNGVTHQISLKDSFKQLYDPTTRDNVLRISNLQELWTTRGIRLGETRRFYNFAGTITVTDAGQIQWNYYLPRPTLDKRGLPLPPTGTNSGYYEISRYLPEYPCFWRQVSYYPRGLNLQFPVPDMLVVEQCLKEAQVTPNIAFESTKEAMLLRDQEKATLRRRSPLQ